MATAGATDGVRSAIMIDGEPAASERPAPALGQHTQDVLRDSNWGGTSP